MPAPKAAGLCHALANMESCSASFQPASVCRQDGGATAALSAMDGKNKLYFGDNLNILRDSVEDASVDLIYLDPPFNSSATYNVLFKEKSGEESAAQITAFDPAGRDGSGAKRRRRCTGKSSRAARVPGDGVQPAALRGQAEAELGGE